MPETALGHTVAGAHTIEAYLMDGKLAGVLGVVAATAMAARLCASDISSHCWRSPDRALSSEEM